MLIIQPNFNIIVDVSRDGGGPSDDPLERGGRASSLCSRHPHRELEFCDKGARGGPFDPVVARVSVFV